jgi:hypothetical protein
MRKSDREKAFEVCAILALYFHTFWHLIYFERGSGSVFISFALFGVFFLYSVTRHWAGRQAYGIRLDNFIETVKSMTLPLVGFLVVCLVVLVVKRESGRWPEASEFVTLPLWGFLQQLIIQGYFLLHYESIFKNKWIAIALAATTFSIVHIPNADLMFITFLTGLYASSLFYEKRNIFAVGLLHGLISLIIITTLRPINVIASDYSVGPQPLGQMRQYIKAEMTPAKVLGVFKQSNLPSSFAQYFEGKAQMIDGLDHLWSFLRQSKPVFVVMAEPDYFAFQRMKPEGMRFVWKRSLMWRRHFKNEGEVVLKSILSLNFKQLARQYRLPVVLISNRPPPKAN